MSGSLSKEETLEHQKAWQYGWDRLSGLYRQFKGQLDLTPKPSGEKEYIRSQWLYAMCRNEAATIEAMGKAYRALNLERYYE
jgi:hypothetical protein